MPPTIEPGAVPFGYALPVPFTVFWFDEPLPLRTRELLQEVEARAVVKALRWFGTNRALRGCGRIVGVVFIENC